MRPAPRATVLILLLLLAPPARAAAPPPRPVDFTRDVAPLLSRSCLRCHQPARKKGDVRLHTFDDLKTGEYVVPGRPDPIVLSRRSFALRLLQYVRDEAHRFAQHYHHMLRTKRTLGDEERLS